jgi:hypothetical protein
MFIIIKMDNEKLRLELDEDKEFGRIFDSLYNEVKKIINEKVDEKNMLKVIVLLMQLVEKQNRFSGLGKKRLVILLLEKLVDDTLDKDEAINVKFLVTSIVPAMIDTLVSVDKKELQIKIKQSISNCWCF